MAHTPRSLLIIKDRNVFVYSDVTHVIEREADAVASFFTAHQAYADMPITHTHTRIGPFLVAKERAVARTATADPTYSAPASRGTKSAITEGLLASFRLPMGLPLTIGKQEAMNGIKSKEFRDEVHRLRPLKIIAACCPTGK